MSAIVESAGRRRGLTLGSVDLAYLAACFVYPPWRFLLPGDPTRDPWWAWFAISALVLVVGIAATRCRWAHSFVRTRLFAFPLAVHLGWLAITIPDEPTYFIALVATVFMSALTFQSQLALMAYTAWIAALLLVWSFESDVEPTYFLAVGWVLLAAHVRHTAENVIRSRANAEIGQLEDCVADQTRLLETTSEHLSEETRRRRQLEEEIEVSHRMESAGRLAGGLAHEFNNQLMTIRLYLDLLKDSLPTDGAIQSDLDTIVRATDRAEALTGRLLSIGRTKRVDGRASVSAVVKESAELLQRVLGEGSRLVVSVGAGHMTVPLDSDRIQEILLNLTINARDAMPDNGTLSIDVTCGTGAGSNSREERTSVCLAVTDTGIGIDAHERPRIFDPYFSTKDDAGRTGLGLAIVYSTVIESGGHIRVISEPGEGARFEITWPLVEPAGEVAPAVAHVQHQQRMTVLLVEDQPEIRAGLRRWLVDAGYEVVDVESAEEAIQVVESGQRFDALASDVVLTGASGIDLVDHLRAREAIGRAVLFSGQATTRGPLNLPIPKDVVLLRKPFSSEDLVEALH